MTKLISLLILLLFSYILQSQENLKKLYVGTFTSEGAEGIYLCHFNSSSGELTLEQVFKGIDNPSFLKIAPDKNHLYAVTRSPATAEKSGGYVAAYKIESNGNLQFVNKQESNGADPCHIDITADGKHAAIATYGGGTVSLYEIETNGILRPASSTIQFEGSGADPSRQKSPHAHCVKFDSKGRQLYCADLGTDRLNIFNIKNNKLIPGRQTHAALPPASGPRHFSIHPNEKVIYVINELNSTITAFERQRGRWALLQTISTVPENFTGANYCADIHVSNDGRFLYGSNRGHNSIAVYKINPKTKKLEWLTSVSSEGEWPRNFTLSPDNRYLLAANQRTGNIAVFRINENGIPEFTGNEIKIPAPVCLEFY